ncbi:MAG: hypothetical protein JWO31_3724 [Phycisphaerales bacterium]|nr:hypothetical protein [Phycisphaerales bacterium]
MPLLPLPPPPWYFPPASGRYEVAPGLSAFGRDMGNGPADACVFQLDAKFPAYRAAKLAARREHFDRHVVPGNLDGQAAARIARFLVNRLAAEHPAAFAVTAAADGSTTLANALTGEAITLDPAGRLARVSGQAPNEPPYVDAVDAIASQVQKGLTTARDGLLSWLRSLR